MAHWAQILYLTGLVVLGLTVFLRPLVYLRWWFPLARLTFSLLGDPQRIPLTAREALRLIDEDPQEFTRRFWLGLLLARASGGGLVFLAAVFDLGILAEIILGR